MESTRLRQKHFRNWSVRDVLPDLTASAYPVRPEVIASRPKDAIDPNRTSLPRETCAASGCPLTKSAGHQEPRLSYVIHG